MSVTVTKATTLKPEPPEPEPITLIDASIIADQIDVGIYSTQWLDGLLERGGLGVLESKLVAILRGLLLARGRDQEYAMEQRECD